ncbi:hypothetical protein EOPP23_17785 [Endozoicomonas sp. OPT23]|nr:hypothetical protein [Endozoicomonas sp. OPT23]
MPEQSRKKQGLAYNPWDSECRFLGGCFMAASASQDLHDGIDNYSGKMDAFWLWNYPSEAELVEAVFYYLSNIAEQGSRNGNRRVSPLLCGIGITHSDLPVLLDLFRRYGLLDNPKAFVFQNQFRSLDLSQLAVAMFNNSNRLLYPKAKNTILSKYTPDTLFESGRAVWTLYEQEKYRIIEERVVEEIACTHRGYVGILDDIRYLKGLEQEDKEMRQKYMV